MNINIYRKLQAATAFFIAMIMAIAVRSGNFILGIAAVLTGMAFLYIAKSKTKGVLVDERTQSVGEKAARISYFVTTLVLASGALLFTFMGTSNPAGDNIPYLYALGVVFSYLTLFALFVYSAAFYYFNKKFGS